LPGLYNSLKAGIATKPVEPFDEAELASQLLWMCPESWQDHYNLMQETVPQETRKLLLALENIEKLGMNEQKNPAANSAGTNVKAANSNGKRKSSQHYCFRFSSRFR
jgi:hypothetical protein